MSEHDKVFHILDNKERTGIQNEITMELKKHEMECPLFRTETKLSREAWMKVCIGSMRAIAMIDRTKAATGR